MLHPLVEAGQALANVQVYCAGQTLGAKQAHQREMCIRDSEKLAGWAIGPRAREESELMKAASEII